MLDLKPNHPKRLGQHFLHEKHYINKILELAAIQPSDYFIEIGPGGGALTESLLPLVSKLIAIEIDSALCFGLKQKLSDWHERLTVYEADALKVDYSQLEVSKVQVRLIGNLPYNIATPLLFHLLKSRHVIYDLHIMVQKEVADRLIAVPGNKIYGRLSVMMQYICQMKRLLVVPPGAFFPPPKVESAVVRMIPFQNPPYQAKDESLFYDIVKTAFSQRRKTIANNLRTLGIQSEQLIQSQIDPCARAEMLTVGDYVCLANNCFESKIDIIRLSIPIESKRPKLKNQVTWN